jgi:hypothetical protein
MDSRERFQAVLTFGKYDRPYRWAIHSFWDGTISRWHEEGLPADINKGNILEYLGVEPFVYMPVPGGMIYNPYVPGFERKVIEDLGENIIVTDTDGIIKKVRKNSSDDFMPQFLEFPVKNRKDFNDIKWRLDMSSDSRLPAGWDKLKNEYSVRDYPLGINIVGVFGWPRNLMGDERLMFAFYDDPELVHEMMSHWLEYYKMYVSNVCSDVVPDFAYIWEDMCYKNGPLISPQIFKEFMSPYLRALIDFIKTWGIKVIMVDTDGDMRKLIEPFLSCGVNAFLPFEVQSGMDVVEIRKAYGKSFAIIGGLDKRVLTEDEGAIRKELDAKLPYMLSQGGYIPGLDHSCPPNVSWKMFRYYIDLVREYEK